jgi:hypothetical protein
MAKIEMHSKRIVRRERVNQKKSRQRQSLLNMMTLSSNYYLLSLGADFVI